MGRFSVARLWHLIDRVCVTGTVQYVNPRETQEALLPTPFVSSYVGRARPGELCQADLAARAAAWAQWSITSFAEMSGMSERSYYALVLPGQFYDPKGTGPKVRPHLEVRDAILRRPASEFPDRLALMGNGLTFPWWVFSEVTAVRRALFPTDRGELGPLLEQLGTYQTALAKSVTALSKSLRASWNLIEGLLVTDPAGLSAVATADFNTDDVAEFFPAAGMGLSVHFDETLRDKARSWASRRVGVWQVRTSDHASVGVVTPRLTSNSLFHDPLFAPATESPAALLVRGLLLTRLLTTYVDATVAPVPLAKPTAPTSFLRAQPAREGAKLPQASLQGAVAFLQTYPNANDAWELLAEWAARTNSALTVTEKGFKASHTNAQRYLRRAEDPRRDDIDVVLPLAWQDGKVTRVTFTRSS